jgi:O-antigen/teichoic acid export membrane protein
MDSIVRVTFPAYSRLQKHPEKLTKALNKSFFFLSFFIIPMSVGLMLTIKPFIGLIPKYSKWEPALFSFYFFVVGSALASISTPLTNALNAVGKIKTTLKLMIMWTVLTWVISPLFIKVIGFNGVAVAHSLIGMTLGIVVWISKKHFKFSVIENIKPALFSASGMGLFGLLLRDKFDHTFVNMLFYAFMLLVSYLFFLLLSYKNKVIQEVQSILLVVRK